MIIPYMKFFLGTELPIKVITIGPTPHPELSVKSIRMLLAEKQLKEVEVIPSEIPYRNW